jgi:hypothetical protein
MVLIRFLLIALIVYMIIRSFMKFGEESDSERKNIKPEKNGKSETKKISKSVGEYVDFEEINKKEL